MNIGDFLGWAGQQTINVGGAISEGTTQGWLNFSGGALGSLGSQLGGGSSGVNGGNYPIYIPVGGGQSMSVNNNTLLYVGLGLLALMLMKK